VNMPGPIALAERERGTLEAQDGVALDAIPLFSEPMKPSASSMVAAIMIGSLLAGTGIAQNPSTPTGGPAGGGEPSNSTGGGAGELEPPDLSRAVAIDSPVFREIERTV